MHSFSKTGWRWEEVADCKILPQGEWSCKMCRKKENIKWLRLKTLLWGTPNTIERALGIRKFQQNTAFLLFMCFLISFYFCLLTSKICPIELHTLFQQSIIQTKKSAENHKTTLKSNTPLHLTAPKNNKEVSQLLYCISY